MLIPLSELNKKADNTFRVCYYISSPSPALKFNSCGYQSEKDYFDFNIPAMFYKEFVFENSSTDTLNKLIP